MNKQNLTENQRILKRIFGKMKNEKSILYFIYCGDKDRKLAWEKSNNHLIFRDKNFNILEKYCGIKPTNLDIIEEGHEKLLEHYPHLLEFWGGDTALLYESKTDLKSCPETVTSIEVVEYDHPNFESVFENMKYEKIFVLVISHEYGNLLNEIFYFFNFSTIDDIEQSVIEIIKK
jgi:hypothetical protein